MLESFLRKARRALGFIGWKTALQALIYPIYRDLIAGGPASESTKTSSPGKLTNFEIQDEKGGILQFENGFRLEVRFLAPDLVRTTWTPGSLPMPYSIREGYAAEHVPLEIREQSGEIVFLTEQLSLVVDARGGLDYSDPSGNRLHRQHPPERIGDEWRARIELRPEEHVYGLGSRAAPLNLRPGSYRFWNTSPGGNYGPGADPLYLCIPVSLHMHREGSFLLFFENSHDGTFTLPDFPSPENPERNCEAGISFTRGALRTYFTSGSPGKVLETYSNLTGRPELPPHWALGFHQSRWGYLNEAQIRSVVAGFEENDLPLDAIHQDIDYMDGFRVFTVNQERFPNMKNLVDDLHQRGIHWIPILDPGVKRDPDYEVYTEGKKRGRFVRLPRQNKPIHAVGWPGWCAFPDFSDLGTRAWWSGLYNRLLELGADGIWHDLNEPEAFAAWGSPTLPVNARHDFEGRGGDHLEGHNLYGLLMNRSGHEALSRPDLEKRPWLLSRSGWAGVQRYAWHWTADVESTWEALRMTIPQVLNIGLSGVPYSGADIGGFSGDPDAELYTRWFQMAALMPFFRNHAAKGTLAREPWVFGAPYTSIVRASLHLRQRLMPYLYTLAWEAAETGAPLVRPLFWLEPENSELWNVEDCFLLGDDLLVAPILEPGARVRRMTLPSGRWTYFWMDYTLEDTHLSEMPVSLQRIPIFVRGGTILPLGEDGKLVVHLYPDAEGRAAGRVYSDSGQRDPGDARIDRFELVFEKGGYTLAWHVEGAKPQPFPWKDIEVKMHCSDLPVRLVSRP